MYVWAERRIKLANVSSKKRLYTMIIENVFKINGVGCIVIGVVKGGDIHEFDAIVIKNPYGQQLQSKVISIENPSVGKMKVAKDGTAVGILLENITHTQVHVGDVIYSQK